jgi:sugar (pentulose or hexulose) kinase
MPKIPVIAVFDIGKTNKKFFLFDQNLKEVYNSYTRLEPVPDEDGFPSEPVLPLRAWMLDTFSAALKSTEFEIKRLNFKFG